MGVVIGKEESKLLGISKFVHQSYGLICRDSDLSKTACIVVKLYNALNIVEGN